MTPRRWRRARHPATTGGALIYLAAPEATLAQLGPAWSISPGLAQRRLAAPDAQPNIPLLIKATNTALDELASPDLTGDEPAEPISRLDIALWLSRPHNQQQAVLSLACEFFAAISIPAVARSSLTAQAFPAADPWSHDLNNNEHLPAPGTWITPTTARVRIAASPSCLSAARGWLIEAPTAYLSADGGASVSGLLETDDVTGRRAALPSYIASLAAERTHRISAWAHAEAAHILLPGASGEQLARLTAESAHVEEAVANHAASRAAVDRHRTALTRAGQQLGRPAAVDTIALDRDADDLQIAAATIDAAAGRTRALTSAAAALTGHQDRVRLQRVGEANTRVTLLFAMVAGALAAGALPTTGHDKLLVTIGSAAGLLGIGSVLLRWPVGYRARHLAAIAIVQACATGLLTSAATCRPYIIAATSAAAAVTLLALGAARNRAIHAARHLATS